MKIVEYESEISLIHTDGKIVRGLTVRDFIKGAAPSNTEKSTSARLPEAESIALSEQVEADRRARNNARRIIQ